MPADGQALGGEYSTSYLPHPIAPRRVAARLPEVKLIVLLRDPVERAYSHFVMGQRNGGDTDCSFDQVVEREIEEVPALLEAHRRGFLDLRTSSSAHLSLPDGTPVRVSAHGRGLPRYPLLTDRELFRFYTTSYIFRSIYCDQLWRWLALFPREQIKIIESRQLMDNRRAVLDDVVHFLGLPAHDFSEEELARTWGGGRNDRNVPGDYPPMEGSTRRRLADFFRPYNEQLFDLIGREYPWS
jgi:hypothetical protein